MSFTDLLVHKGTILRKAEIEDPFHNKDNYYAVHLTDEPCRATVSSLGGGFANIGGERLEETVHHVMEDRRVYFKAGLDIIEEDVIEVRDAYGNLVFPRSDITFVRHIYDGNGNEHHTEVLVKVWRDADEL